MGSALPALTSLRVLDLCHNNIGDEGCSQICEALQQNNVVRTLLLAGNNNISDIGANALIESVKAHPTLTVIKVNATNASDSVKAKLQYYLDLNNGPRTVLNAPVPLPLSLWHRAFKRADDCRRVSDNGTEQMKAPDMLYYLIK
jgi:hypothetical protein